MKKWYKTLKIEAEILENLKQLKGVYKVDNMSQVLREMMYSFQTKTYNNSRLFLVLFC